MSIDADWVKAQADLRLVIEHYGIVFQKTAGRWTALCPFHQEDTPSFHINPDGGGYKCFGCDAKGDVFEFVMKFRHLSFDMAIEEVASICGISAERQMFDRTRKKSSRGPCVASYYYYDERGEILFQIDRHEPGTDGRTKDFLQYGFRDGAKSAGMADIRRVLYCLPEVLAADRVFVVEGEKDAESLRALGLTATTKPGGAGAKWLPEYTAAVKGKKVYVIPDNDTPGVQSARAVLACLDGQAQTALLVLPHSKDATEWLANGGSIEELETLVAAITPRPEGLLTFSQIFDSLESIEELLSPATVHPGLPTEWPRLNAVLGGLRPGSLTYVGARPGVGKTTLVFQLAYHVAAVLHIPVAMFTLEMRHVDLTHRLLAFLSNIPLHRFLNEKEQSRDERRRLAEATEHLRSIPILLDDNEIASVNSSVKKLEKAIGDGHKIGLVIFDYIGLMATDERAENRNQEVSKISRGLKLAAKRFKLPFIAASQLTRPKENRKPELSDLRESGSLEQDADNVILLHKLPAEHTCPFDPIDVYLAKHRQGPTGVVPMQFIKESARLVEVA